MSRRPLLPNLPLHRLHKLLINVLSLGHLNEQNNPLIYGGSVGVFDSLSHDEAICDGGFPRGRGVAICVGVVSIVVTVGGDKTVRSG